jgi:hypothetical protein
LSRSKAPAAFHLIFFIYQQHPLKRLHATIRTTLLHAAGSSQNQLYQVTIETGAKKLQWVSDTRVRIVLGAVPLNFMGPVNVPLDSSSTSQLFTTSVASNVEVHGPRPRLLMEVFEDHAWVNGFDDWDVTKVIVKHVATGNQWQYGPFRFTGYTGSSASERAELPFSASPVLRLHQIPVYQGLLWMQHSRCVLRARKAASVLAGTMPALVSVVLANQHQHLAP